MSVIEIMARLSFLRRKNETKRSRVSPLLLPHHRCTKNRDIVSISSDKTYSLIRSTVTRKEKKRGGGKKCNKADSLESLHTALTENTCSETNIPRDYKVSASKLRRIAIKVR